MQPIRTASEITVKIIIQPLYQISLYQKLAEKVRELYALGMTFREIAKTFKTSEKTVIRAYKYK